MLAIYKLLCTHRDDCVREALLWRINAAADAGISSTISSTTDRLYQPLECLPL